MPFDFESTSHRCQWHADNEALMFPSRSTVFHWSQDTTDWLQIKPWLKKRWNVETASISQIVKFGGNATFLLGADGMLRENCSNRPWVTLGLSSPAPIQTRPAFQYSGYISPRGFLPHTRETLHTFGTHPRSSANLKPSVWKHDPYNMHFFRLLTGRGIIEYFF